jgi:hypothetical protein
MNSLREKAFTKVSIISDFMSSGQPLGNPEELLVRLSDAQQDKRDTLKATWSHFEDECKRIQDEIDRGCFSNPLDIIFEVHETISKYFVKKVKISQKGTNNNIRRWHKSG